MKMFENIFYCMVLPQLREETLDTMASTLKEEPRTHTDKHGSNSKRMALQGMILSIIYENGANP